MVYALTVVPLWQQKALAEATRRSLVREYAKLYKTRKGWLCPNLCPNNAAELLGIAHRVMAQTPKYRNSPQPSEATERFLTIVFYDKSTGSRQKVFGIPAGSLVTRSVTNGRVGVTVTYPDGRRIVLTKRGSEFYMIARSGFATCNRAVAHSEVLGHSPNTFGSID